MSFRTIAATLLGALALALATGPALARTNATGGAVLRYPSGTIPDANALAAAISDPSVGTIVFEKGVNPFTSSIAVFRRTGLTLCGATKKASDTVIESSATVALLLDESTGVTVRDLTIRSTAANGEAMRLQSVRSSSVEGFVRDVTLRGCRFEAWVPLRGTVRANGLDVADCTLDVTRSGGVGILWEDGPALLVTRTKFTTSATDVATAAVLVRGALVAESEGDRARGVILTKNEVSGDFTTGFDLADVVDARVLRNRVTYSTPTYGTGDTAGGRVGIVVRRQAASAQTEDFEVRSNVVKGAHTGVWCLNTGAGKLVSNDLRGSGAAAVDARFADTGCAVRVGLLGPICGLTIRKNDFRGLRSPAGEPAVRTSPVQSGSLCFAEDGESTDQDVGNRVDAGRPVYE